MEMSINGFLSIPKKERMKLIKKLKVETKERIFKNTLKALIRER